MKTILEASPVGTEELADWIELLILKSGERGVGTQRLMEETRNQLGLEENRFALAFNSMRKRALLVQNYPFILEDVAVIAKSEFHNSSYLLLLLLSRPTQIMAWQTNSPSLEELEVFESLVCKSLCSYLGSGAEAVSFGWPSKAGRPENFDQAVKWLAAKMGILPGNMYRPPRRKDGGVDIFVWRKFPDNRSGFQIGLVQCTLQQNYVAKSRDIDLRLWSRWLEMDRDPLTILAIPQAVSGDEQWQEATANSIVFERIRLSQNYEFDLDQSSVAFVRKILLKLSNS